MMLSEEEGALEKNAQEELQAHERLETGDSRHEERPDPGQRAIAFDWQNRWLRGDEYYHILSNAELYAATFDFRKFTPKTHPPSTYTAPEGLSPNKAI